MKRWLSRWLLAFLVPGLLATFGCGGSNPPVTASNDSAAAPTAPPGPPPGPPGPPAAVPGPPPAAVPGPPARPGSETQPEGAPTPEAQPPAAEPAPPSGDPNQPENVPAAESANPLPSGEAPPADPQATGALAGAVLDFFSGLAGKPKAPAEGQPAEGQPQAEQPQPENPAEAQPNPGDNQAQVPAAIPVLELVPEKTRPFVELAMNRALEAYKKKNPSGPADADELINKVLKPKGIRLPKLPPGAQFVLDPNSGQLMIQPGAPAPAGEAAPGIGPAKGARKSIE